MVLFAFLSVFLFPEAFIWLFFFILKSFYNLWFVQNSPIKENKPGLISKEIQYLKICTGCKVENCLVTSDKNYFGHNKAHLFDAIIITPTLNQNRCKKVNFLSWNYHFVKLKIVFYSGKIKDAFMEKKPRTKIHSKIYGITKI